GEIRPVKLSSGVWQYPGNVSFADGTQLSGTSGSINTTTNVLTWSGLTSFSEFGGGGQGGPLPVELTSFAASCEEDVVTLSWSTASEQNSSHFDVEKSIDGEIWRVIGTVLAAGNSTQDINYSFIDDEKSNTQNYYRLNQVDIDGKNEYFGPIQTNCVEKIQFTTFPNPSDASFQVILTSKELVGMCNLVISDATGKLIEQRTIDVKEGINLFVFNQEFTPGIYFLNVTNGTKSTPILRHAVK
ncbi:MAG: T9SS type A sorting domain-containing protein, partial [Crocinitomicaceae bacterium]